MRGVTLFIALMHQNLGERGKFTIFSTNLQEKLLSPAFCLQGLGWMLHKKSLKGAVSAQKALQGSETETRELLRGTEEKSVSLMRVL